MLGGTAFVGRHIAEAAIERGHRLTFFNRGTTNPELFSEHAQIRGERERDAELLSGVDADVVVDTCGYTPDAVRASAEAVRGTVERYGFFSSVDVYDYDVAEVDERSVTREMPAGATTSERSAELYGAHKARCERDLVDVL